jgi:predicted negative regulator of RcsB-dependent stress response
LAPFAAWNGWQYWQRSQAAQAAAMYDEVESAASGGRHGAPGAQLRRHEGQVWRHHLLRSRPACWQAKTFQEKGNADGAKAALDLGGRQGLGRPGLPGRGALRLAGVLLDAKAYDEALKQLTARVPRRNSSPGCRPPRRHPDLLQGKKAEARASYGKAFKGLDERTNTGGWWKSSSTPSGWTPSRRHPKPPLMLEPSRDVQCQIASLPASPLRWPLFFCSGFVGLLEQARAAQARRTGTHIAR